MNSKSVEKILYWAQTGTILLLSFLVAVLLSRQTVDSSVLKTSWALGLSICIFMLFTLRTIIKKKGHSFIYLEIAVLAYWAYLIFNGLFISNFPAESYHQLFKVTSYVMIFFGVSEMASSAQFRKLFNYFMITLAGVLISYGIMQKLGWDIFQWENASSSRRILSTFGNSIFYANFLLFLLPIVLANLVLELIRPFDVDEDVSPMKYFLSFITMLIFFSIYAFLIYKIARSTAGFNSTLNKTLIFGLIFLYFGFNIFLFNMLKRAYLSVYLLTMSILGVYSLIMTLSRGAWLGFLPMLFYLVIWVAYYLSKKGIVKLPGKKLMLIAVGSVVGILIITVFLLPRDIKLRIKEVRFSSTTVQVRFTIWEGALKMIKKRPIAGYGVGSYQLNFPENRPQDYSLKSVSNNTINTHSEYLQIASNTGFIGLILFGFIAILLIKGNIKYLLNPPNREDFFFAMALGSGLIAVLIHSFWSVSMRFTSTVVYFYIYLGLFNGMIRQQTEKNPELIKKPFLPMTIVLLIFALGIIPWIRTADKFYLRDYYIRQGMITDTLRGDVGRERSRTFANFGSFENNPAKLQKLMELMYKADLYWYKIRGISLKKKETDLIKSVFNKLAAGEKDKNNRILYLTALRSLEKFIKGELTSYDSRSRMIRELNSAFNLPLEDGKLRRLRQQISPILEWVFFAVEAENSGFQEIRKKVTDTFRSGKASTEDIRSIKPYFERFTDNLLKMYSAKTVVYYDLGLIIDPYTYDCAYKKASAQYDLAKFTEAMKTYLALEAIAPNYTQLHYNKGVVLKKFFRTGKTEKEKMEFLERSREELEKSKHLNPYFINTRMLLAAVYRDLGREKEYFDEYKFSYDFSFGRINKMLTLHPISLNIQKDDLIKNVKIWASTGKVLLAKGDQHIDYRNDLITLQINTRDNIKRIQDTQWDKVPEEKIKAAVETIMQLRVTANQLLTEQPKIRPSTN